MVAVGCTGCVTANRWGCWDVSSRITVPMRMHRTKHDDNQSIGNRHIFIYVFISFGGNHLERLLLLVPGSRESRRSVICCPAGGRGLLPQWPTANGSRHPNPCGQPPGTRPRNRVNAKPAAAGAASSSASTECGREPQAHARGVARLEGMGTTRRCRWRPPGPSFAGNWPSAGRSASKSAS